MRQGEPRINGQGWWSGRIARRSGRPDARLPDATTPATADSFRFDACLKRERLLDILRSAATA